MLKTHHAVGFILLLIVLFCALESVFTVDQREQAIVLQLGQPVGTIKGPGLHFKIPLVQDVVRFDRRILSVDPAPTQMVISSNRDAAAPVVNAATPAATPAATEDNIASGEPIIVDTFARYDITDPLKFLKTLQTIDSANHRLESIVNDATRAVLGNTTLHDLLSKDRNEVMADILARANKKVHDDQLGINIIDIRIVRADLTPELRQSTVRRMISELKERATQTRAEGEEKALEIRSTAEKERTVILAEADRDSQIARGEGDQQAIKIYADAFNKDKDFYAFTRSMEAYKTTLATPDTRLILSPDSAFFRYFRDGPDASRSK